MIKKGFSLVLFLLIILSTPTPSFCLNESGITASEFSLLIDAFIEENECYQSNETNNSREGSYNVLTNRLIVVTDNNLPLANDCNAVDKLEGFNNWHIFQYDSVVGTNAAYSYFNSQEYVYYVEYDRSFAIDNFDDNTDCFETFNLAEEYGSQIVNSSVAVKSINAQRTTQKEIVVAVIDTGVDATHPFFNKNGTSRILPSNDEDDNCPSNNSSKSAHGTHVAGIIVNNTPENVKIRSINYLASLSQNQYTSILSSKIKLAIDENVDVINMSIAFPLENEGDTSILSDTINAAVSKGIVLVAASGNYKENATYYLPGCLGSVITVSATNKSNKPWNSSTSDEGSNYGNVVDISAPGEDIISTVPNNKFEPHSGTSMAAPFVSAAAAILKTVNPTITPQSVKDRLKNTAYVPSGWNTDYGVGIVDFRAMLADKMTYSPTITVSGHSATITAEPIATVYYTTNGTDPSVESIIYTNPIDITNIEEIRAISIKPEYLASEVVINANKNIDVIYKNSKKITFPDGKTALSVNNLNPEIAVVSESGKVKGVGLGDAVSKVDLGSGSFATYHIHVDYHPIIRKIINFFSWLLKLFGKR